MNWQGAVTGAGSGAGGRSPQRRLRRSISPAQICAASPQPTRRARHGATRRRRRHGDRSGSAVTGVWYRRRSRSVRLRNWLRNAALSRRGPSGRAAARASARAAAAPHGWRAHCGARVQGCDRRRVCRVAEATAAFVAAAAAEAAEAAARPGAIMLGESCEQMRTQAIPKPQTAASAATSAAAASASAEGLWETAKDLLRRRRVRGTDIGQMKSRRARTGRAAEAKGGQARAEASSDEGVAKLGHPRRRGHATWASGAATAAAAAAAAATSATSTSAAATSAAALAAGKAPAAAVGGSPRRVRSPKLLCGEVGGASW